MAMMSRMSRGGGLLVVSLLLYACSEGSPRHGTPDAATSSSDVSAIPDAQAASSSGSGGRGAAAGGSASSQTAADAATPDGSTSSRADAAVSTDAASDSRDDDAGSLPPVGDPSPATSYGDFTGVCAYGADEFPALAAIGVKNARFDRPSASIIEAARSYGIEVLPLANYGFTDLSGQSDDKYPPLPENRAEWAKRMVDTWRSMQDPPRVIEVWNEPWNTSFWPPHPDAPAYLELVKAFAKEAWAQWPTVTLLVSADEGEGNAYAFRKELLAADTTGFLNDPRILPTTHDYVEGRTPTQVTGQPCSWDLDRFQCAYADFKAHGHPDPQVWVTEFGWESNTANGTNAVTPVTEAQQAEYTTDALRSFRSSGKVAKAFAFLFHRNDPWNYNWLRPDNSQKPVCDSVKTLIAMDR